MYKDDETIKVDVVSEQCELVSARISGFPIVNTFINENSLKHTTIWPLLLVILFA